MTILELLKRVRCVSQFDARDLEPEVLESVLLAASWTPSAADAQPWEFIVIRDEEQKQSLCQSLLDSLLRARMGGAERRSWMSDAPVILVLCLDCIRAKVRYGEIGETLFGPQDTGAALQNLRLVALENGIKSCVVREFDREQVSELLALPGHVRPLALVALGYSDVEPSQKTGLPLEDYVHWETW